jgi:hypothetical protein
MSKFNTTALSPPMFDGRKKITVGSVYFETAKELYRFELATKYIEPIELPEQLPLILLDYKDMAKINQESFKRSGFRLHIRGMMPNEGWKKTSCGRLAELRAPYAVEIHGSIYHARTSVDDWIGAARKFKTYIPYKLIPEGGSEWVDTCKLLTELGYRKVDEYPDNPRDSKQVRKLFKVLNSEDFLVNDNQVAVWTAEDTVDVWEL